MLLTFSGNLYGYTVTEARSTDLGYPSTAIRRRGRRGDGVTMYYYNPALREARRSATDEKGQQYTPREGNPFYSGRNYLTVAVSWDEAELIEAVGRAT